MDKKLLAQLNNLKIELLALKPSGEDGFEGLLGSALGEIVGIPFRFAKSGSQRGIDGKAAYDEDFILFEAKRYDQKIPRSEVITKIADLARYNQYPDFVWILGATTQVSTQDADDLRQDAQRAGFSTLILDWSENQLPELAIALAKGGKSVDQFLEKNLDSSSAKVALEALRIIRKNSAFKAAEGRVASQINGASQSWAFARSANLKWLNEIFSDKKIARNRFGQPLSPHDSSLVKLLPRATLVSKIQSFFGNRDNQEVIYILGKEGCGKSWVMAQSWLTTDNKPFTIIMNAESIADSISEVELNDLLIDKIIEQTNDIRNEINRKRWLRRLTAWKSIPIIDRYRFIVILDGVNQKPHVDWGRVIDVFADLLRSYSGQLFVTSRESYFRTNIQRRAGTPKVEIKISDWSTQERDEILSARSIHSAALHQSVVSSLLNPRLLNIALELFDNESFLNFDELDVNRVLLEHIKLSEQDSPIPQPTDEFFKQLREHALKIIDRLKSEDLEDITVFEDANSSAVEGRFFEKIEDDIGVYKLTADGLPLALGLAIISNLKKADRNHKDLDESLALMIEPISALDMTADIILASLTILIVESQFYSTEIISALIKGFVSLQNTDDEKLPVFANLARTRINDFMLVLEDLCLKGGRQANFDWIKSSIISASSTTESWKIIATHLKKWFSYFSLSPELLLSYSSREEPEKRLEEISKRKQELEEKVSKLSQVERALINSLTRMDQGDLDTLSSTAMHIAAGKPLVEFVPSIVNWCFSHSINSSNHSPYKDFLNLIGFNCIDWSATRQGLLEIGNTLDNTSISTTGKWVLVSILNSTGSSTDDERADKLVDELRRADQQKSFPAWRRIEDYCSSDPCDPKSQKPTNIDNTASSYQEIDVNQIWCNRNQTQEGIFLEDAQVGLARFKPDAAIEKYQQLITNILDRTGFSLRQGIFHLQTHNALFTSNNVKKVLLNRVSIKNNELLEDVSDNDKWFVKQYHLLMAFSFLSPKEQVQQLLKIESDESVLVKLVEIMQPITPDEFDELLIEASDNNKIFNMLGYAYEANLILTKFFKSFLKGCINNSDSLVRMQVFKIICVNQDPELIQSFVDSNWSANESGSDHVELENWFGSKLLILSAKNGIISELNAIDRISSTAYGQAAELLSSRANDIISQRLDIVIKNIISTDIENTLFNSGFEVEINVDSEHNEFGRSSIKDTPIDDMQNSIERHSESNEAFVKRHKDNYELFNEFRVQLKNARIDLIVNALTPQQFSIIANANSDLSESWFKLFSGSSNLKLPQLYNLILLLAFSQSETEPAKSELLWGLLKKNKPITRITFGEAGTSLELMSVWAGKRNEKLDKIRFRRLDVATQDNQIFQEVFAAIVNNNHAVILDYVKIKMSREEPSQQAKGLIVAGCLDENMLSNELLEKYKYHKGLIGAAHKAALYMYERNQWAKHWYKLILEAESNEDLWKYMILLTKIVDSRFFVWKDSIGDAGAVFEKFKFTFSGDIKRRCQKWSDLREKKYSGIEPPNPIFVYVNAN